MVFLFAFLIVIKQYLANHAWFRATYDFSNQFPFPCKRFEKSEFHCIFYISRYFDIYKVM